MSGAPAGAIGVLVTGSFLPGAPATTQASAVSSADNGIVALVPNGSFIETATGLQIVPIAGNFSFSSVNTPNVVNSCSVDQNTETGVCTANNTDIYIINFPNPGPTPSATLSSAGTGTVTFTGGTCTNCGVVVDSSTHKAVIGISLANGASGYQILDLNTNQLSTPIVANGSNISESWAIESSQQLILSPSEATSGRLPNYQIFNVSNPAAPKLFNFAGAKKFPSSADLDSAAIDSTGIILGTMEFDTRMFIADLSRATFSSRTHTWNAPNQIQDLGMAFSPFLPDGLTAIAVAVGAHEALMIDEFGTTAFAALQLPATAGSGTPAVQDWAVASMPNDPTGTGWQMPYDPHGLTAAFVNLNGNRGIGVLMNLQRTFLAVVDLGAMLNAPRSSDMHTIDPTFDLVKNGVVTFIAIGG